MKNRITFLAMAGIFVLPSVDAAITYDGFDYTAGSTLAGNTDWTSLNTGTAPVIASGNLTVSGLEAPTGGKVTFASGNIQEALGTLSTYSSGTIYYSFAFTLTAAPTTTTYSFALATGNTNYAAVIWLQASDEGYNIGLSNRSNSTPTYGSTVYDLNSTIFVVGSYTFVDGTANDTSSLWINPDSSTFSGTPSTATLTATGGTDMSAISQFLLRGAAGSPSGELDELRIGTTWESVTPIPEPASMLLGAFGLLGILRRRR